MAMMMLILIVDNFLRNIYDGNDDLNDGSDGLKW